MVTMLDCIKRVPKIVDIIIDQRKELTKDALDYLEDKLDTIDQIIFVGSGTSNTCSLTSKEFVEKASGLDTRIILPNEFMYKSVYNKNALYVFVSQSGTSTLTQVAQNKIKDLGYARVAITEAETTPLAQETGVHIRLEADNEEYGMRTLGYCGGALTEMVLAMEIGLKRGYLSEADYNTYIEEAKRVPESHKAICEATLNWFDDNKWALMNKDAYVVYGAGTLWGVAVEGALKILETAKRYMAVGYEIDDGLHGPTMGFTDRHCVLILNDGERDLKLMDGIANYMKEEVGTAFVVGCKTVDDTDLAFTPKGGNFKFLEYAPVVEIIAYRLAVDYGIKVVPFTEMVMPEAKYFNTHDE